MQRVKARGARTSRVRSLRRRIHESDVLTGLTAGVVVVILIVVAGYVYLSPPNKQTVTFTTRDAASLSGGEDVRVAGISVGKVAGIDLASDHVSVDLEIESDVRIGDRTRADVRLLTAVGGYFVTLVPGGQVTPTSRVIAADRVTVPYTIADTLQHLPRITSEVRGVPMEQTLAQLSDGLQHNSDSVRNLVSGMQSLAEIVDKQKHQVTSILSMASNYLTTFNSSSDFVFELIRKINVVLSAFYPYRAGFTEAYRQLGLVARRLGVVAQFYVNHEDQFYRAVSLAENTAGQLRDGMSDMIATLEPLRDRLMSLLGNGGADGPWARFTLDATKMCQPVPGRSC